MKGELTAEDVRAAFTYDPDTGVIERRDSSAKRREHTGTINHRRDTSYRVLCLNYRKLYAHRVAWLIAHGEIDSGLVIDHINGDGLDNRLENLRLVPRSLNQRNRRLSRSNRTGVTGVNHHKNGFAAGCAGEYLGHFPTLEEAAAARAAAEPRLGVIRNNRRSKNASS